MHQENDDDSEDDDEPAIKKLNIRVLTTAAPAKVTKATKKSKVTLWPVKKSFPPTKSVKFHFVKKNPSTTTTVVPASRPLTPAAAKIDSVAASSSSSSSSSRNGTPVYRLNIVKRPQSVRHNRVTMQRGSQMSSLPRGPKSREPISPAVLLRKVKSKLSLGKLTVEKENGTEVIVIKSIYLLHLFINKALFYKAINVQID